MKDLLIQSCSDFPNVCIIFIDLYKINIYLLCNKCKSIRCGQLNDYLFINCDHFIVRVVIIIDTYTDAGLLYKVIYIIQILCSLLHYYIHCSVCITINTGNLNIQYYTMYMQRTTVDSVCELYRLLQQHSIGFL